MTTRNFTVNVASECVLCQIIGPNQRKYLRPVLLVQVELLDRHLFLNDAMQEYLKPGYSIDTDKQAEILD